MLADVQSIAWSWDFGDGQVDNVSVGSATHTFAAAGVYTVTLTTTDALSAKTVQMLNAVVKPVVGELDSDGDGFFDGIEVALGSDPLDANSTPLGKGPAVPLALFVKSLKTHLDPKQSGDDGYLLSGTLPVTAGMSFKNQRVLIDVGGSISVFNLDANGNAALGPKSGFSLRVKSRKGVIAAQDAPFTMRLQGISLRDAGSKGQITVSVIFNGQFFQATPK